MRARQEPPGRDIVVVGASAGGVEALRTLVAGLPEDFPAAMFVVLHVPPTSSVLPAILTRAGKLPAEHARDEDAIQHGRIYVAPPDYHLLVEEDVMRLERGPRENGHRWVGQWSRDCGQRYRVQVEPLTFWPQNSASGFRSEPPEACVSCGAQLEEAFALGAARIVLRLRGCRPPRSGGERRDFSEGSESRCPEHGNDSRSDEGAELSRRSPRSGP